jgi:uncharacterized protein (TIGR00251 family)
MEKTRGSVTRLNIRVKPGSGKQSIESVGNKSYKVSLKSLAVDNKANLELIKLMKKHLKKNIKIIKGFKSKDKVIEVNQS